MTYTHPIETVPPVESTTPIAADAPRVEVASQQELAEAVAGGRVPVLGAPENFAVGSGVLVESRVLSRLAATGDARVISYDQSSVTAADDVQVEAHDRSSVRVFGSAQARLYDFSSGRAEADDGEQPFFDGVRRHPSTSWVWLYDDAVFQSWAPGSVIAHGRSGAVLHCLHGTSHAELFDTSTASLDGDVVASAHDDTFVVAHSGSTVTASGRSVVVASPLDDGARAPQLRGDERSVIVVPPGVDADGPRVLPHADALAIDTWLSIWGLAPRDGAVDLLVPVNAATGVVNAEGWKRKPALTAGGPVPDNLPVLARASHWHRRSNDDLRLLTVRVPVTALRPATQPYRLYLAYASDGVVVG